MQHLFFVAIKKEYFDTFNLNIMKRIIMTILCITLLVLLTTSCYTTYKCPAYSYNSETSDK
jgi:hypothetical protein